MKPDEIRQDIHKTHTDRAIYTDSFRKPKIEFRNRWLVRHNLSEMSDTTIKSNSVTYKKVCATYHVSSEFLIPEDCQDYWIKWDFLYYTDKEGKTHKVTPRWSATDDTEFMKRPGDIDEEEADEEEQEDAPTYDELDDVYPNTTTKKEEEKEEEDDDEEETQ